MKAQTGRAITSAISSNRFQTYLNAANGNKERALELYLWNVEAAAAVISTTGMVEVQLRNSINDALQRWNMEQPVTTPGRTRAYSADWLTDPAPKLAQIISRPNQRPLWENALKTMKDINGNVTKPNPTHDDLVAGLTLGSWTSLLPIPTAGSRNARVHIWENALQSKFQSRSKHNQYPCENRNAVYYWANCVRYARNRASHLEPLLDNSELLLFHRTSIRLLHSMNADTASWLAGQAYIPKVMRRRP